MVMYEIKCVIKNQDVESISKKIVYLLESQKLDIFNKFKGPFERTIDGIYSRLYQEEKDSYNHLQIKKDEKISDKLFIDLFHENNETHIFRDKGIFEEIYNLFFEFLGDDLLEMDANWQTPMNDIGGSDFYYAKSFDIFLESIILNGWKYKLSEEKIRELTDYLSQRGILNKNNSILIAVEVSPNSKEHEGEKLFDYMEKNYSEYKIE